MHDQRGRPGGGRERHFERGHLAQRLQQRQRHDRGRWLDHVVGPARGQEVGVEVGFVDHLLLLEALKTVGLNELDVDIVNVKTQQTPEMLASGAVSAIAAWQPNSGRALQATPGAKALFTQRQRAGLDL